MKRFALFEIAFPLQKRLIDCLKGESIWFKHQEGSCFLLELYNPKHASLRPKRCENCQKQDLNFKVCSRCRQAYYCDPECQKAHYPRHKQVCQK